MAYDGVIRFKTRIDNTNIEKEMKDARKKIENNLDAINKSTTAKLPLENALKGLNEKLEEAEHKAYRAKLMLDRLKDQQSFSEGVLANATATPETYNDKYAVDPETFIKIKEGKAGLDQMVTEKQALYEAAQKEVSALQNEWKSVNKQIHDYDLKIQQTTVDLEFNKAKAAQLTKQMNSSGYKMAQAFARAKESAAKFRNQILRVGTSMLMFRVFSAVLQGISQYMGKILKTNAEYTAQLAQLKAALATAFQPIYEFILPGLMAVLRVLTSIVLVVANVLSALGGKTLGQSSKNAKALNEEADAIGAVGGAAKEAKKELAGFDEINTLGSPDSGGGGGGGASGGTSDFADFDTAEYKTKIDELTVYLSGALLALGAILAFSGANIPLGIGLMAAGAIGLASVVKANWGAMSGELTGALTKVALVLGGAALAIGAILAFSGVSVAKGIALMAVGAAALAGSAALNWNTIVSYLQGPVGEVVAIAAASLLCLGLVLACSGMNVPLGIALIAAGAVGLVTVGALNWNVIQERLAQTWAGIKQWFTTHVQPKLTLSYWQDKFSTIADALEKKIRDGVNVGIALFNRFISWINEKMRLSWGDFSVLGEKVINAGSFQLLTLPQIPMLAQGAVLPANKPFLAMVGDQKNGTNVEAPLDTIKQALAEVMAMYGGDGDIVIRFEGDLAQLARVLNPVITRENKRVGPSLAGGNT